MIGRGQLQNLLARDIDALGDVDLHLYGRLCAYIEPPPGLRAIPGQISEREGRVLYDLAAQVWNGRGNVLELGTLFGASTQWLGLGMAANPAREGQLVAADAFGGYFSMPEMVAQLEPLLGDRQDWPAVVAEFERTEFLRAFLALHAEGQPYSEFLTVRRCLVPRAPGHSYAELEDLVRASSPIAVLVVDSVKSWYPVRALAIAVIERLLPGALLAWQDQRWFNSFAIPFLNEHLAESMHLLAVVDGMHVYRYTGGSTAAAVSRAMPDTVAAVATDDVRTMFHELAWRSYVANDAYGVLSAALQLSFVLANQGHVAEATTLFDAARTVPGFAAHRGLFEQAQRELGEL
jgi:hypothetical protein